ncbi:hypothetical protein SDC9_158654 [bioreactor metagenome]|uniref:Uncharacterized protein n=1 Tax=bioreactor metagenome TaxID=1076179 RepID=A0A645FG58_9ZZZZ
MGGAQHPAHATVARARAGRRRAGDPDPAGERPHRRARQPGPGTPPDGAACAHRSAIPGHRRNARLQPGPGRGRAPFPARLHAPHRTGPAAAGRIGHPTRPVAGAGAALQAPPTGAAPAAAGLEAGAAATGHGGRPGAARSGRASPRAGLRRRSPAPLPMPRQGRALALARHHAGHAGPGHGWRRLRSAGGARGGARAPRP